MYGGQIGLQQCFVLLLEVDERAEDGSGNVEPPVYQKLLCAEFLSEEENFMFGMGAALKFASIWRSRARGQAAFFSIVTASLALSMVVVCCIYMLIPQPLEPRRATINYLRPGRELGKQGSRNLGRFGMRMVEMVAHDLPFTIFVPVEGAVNKLLRSCARNAGDMENENVRIGDSDAVLATNSSIKFIVLEDREASVSKCVTAVVSRIMSFSTVPKQIVSTAVPEGREMELETLSGYKLYLARDPRRGFVVNNHTFVSADIRRGLLLIHIIDGVLMDSMFEKSIDFEDD